MIVRRGGPADVDAVIALLDDAVRWLVSQGRTGQWGTEPFSGNSKRVEQVRSWADELWLAEQGGEVAGALALGEAPAYAPPSDVPEVYITGLVGGRGPHARGAGRLLIEHARAEASRRGVSRLRVDCYAGDDGALVDFYVSTGFTPTDRFTVGSWPGQILEITPV